MGGGETDAPSGGQAGGGRTATAPKAEPAAGETPARRSFPPPNVTPPFERSAQPGDGEWKALGSATAGDGKALLYTTVIRPHKVASYVTVTLVAVDLGAVRLRFMPGVDDVGKQQAPFAPGLVPVAERERVIAAFNGGFMPRHGRWGMRLGELTVLPPREQGCTVAVFEDGSVRVRSWPALSSDAERAEAIRQTPPCLVERGAVHRELLRGNDAPWKGQTPGIVTRRRSAIGLSADGSVLYYAVGLETPARLLAEGLLAAGVHDAAELDINWNWTRFLLFGRNEEGALRVVESLVEVEHSSRSYVERPSERDFFYLLRR